MATPVPTIGSTPDGTASPSYAPIAIVGPGGGGGGGGTSGTSGGAGSIGSSGGGPTVPGLLLPVLMAMLVGGGGLMVVATRRRRRAPVPVVVIEAPMPAQIAAPMLAQIAAPIDDPFNDAHLPRWRRPSVQAARMKTGRGEIEPTWQLAFKPGAPVGGERRKVRYRLVRMSDAPDEIRSSEIGQLEADDEVEVLERYAGFILVRTPLGTEGWVHRTTLGDPIGADGEELDEGDAGDTPNEDRS